MADPATWAPTGEGRAYDLARAAYWAMVRDPQRSLLGADDSALLTSRRRGGSVTDAAFAQLHDYALTFRVRVRRGVGELVADEGSWPLGIAQTTEQAHTQALALLGSLLIVPGVPRHFARRAA